MNNRTKELSNKQYNAALGLALLWGFGVNAIMCTFFTHLFATVNIWIVVTIYLLSCTIGCILVHKKGADDLEICQNPKRCFLGYNMIVLPIGMVLCTVFAQKNISTASIAHAFIITSLVTALMLILSSVWPKIFLSIKASIAISLLAVVLFEILLIFTGIGTPRWWDWIVVLFFCAMIGCDWATAQKGRKTLGNAIANAVQLYLDIMIVFSRSLDTSKGDNK